MILPFLNLYLLATRPGLCGGYSLNRHSAHDLIHPGTGRLLRSPASLWQGDLILSVWSGQNPPWKWRFSQQLGVHKVCRERERDSEQVSPSWKPLKIISPRRRFVVLGESGLRTIIRRGGKIGQSSSSVLHDKSVCQCAVFKWDGARGLERWEPRTWGEGAGCLSPPFPGMSVPTTGFDDVSKHLLWNAFTPGSA